MTTSRWQPDEETPRTYARLSGDHNPVHLDPEVAQAAGFPGVVVHGMCVLGAVARAAAAAAPSDRQLRKLDVRFAGPAFPGQELVMEPSPKELPDGSLRVMMKVTHEGQGLMAPATFVFRAGDLDEATTTTLLRGAEVEPRDDHVVAEEYTFDEGHVLDYLTLTAPDPCVEQVGLPALMGTLGLTDALWYAFANASPVCSWSRSGLTGPTGAGCRPG